MKHLFRLLMGILILGVMIISCSKIDHGHELIGDLQYVQLEGLDAIPASYGKLKTITTHSMYDGWAQLWFEDEQQTIRMVRVNFHSRRINEDVLIIKRK